MSFAAAGASPLVVALSRQVRAHGRTLPACSLSASSCAFAVRAFSDHAVLRFARPCIVMVRDAVIAGAAECPKRCAPRDSNLLVRPRRIASRGWSAAGPDIRRCANRTHRRLLLSLSHVFLTMMV